jgi:hypothetical protein
MTTANTNATRASVVAQFQAIITQPINATSKWSTGANPGSTAGGAIGVAGTPGNGFVPDALINIVQPGDVVYAGPYNTDIAAGNASVSNTQLVLQNAAIALSASRLVRLLKISYPYTSYFYDATAPTHLNASYQMASAPTVPAAPDGTYTLSASTLDAYINTLLTAIQINYNSVVTLTEYYCHSSCHTNHTSRGRR